MPKGGGVRKPNPIKTNPKPATRPGTWGKPPQNPQPAPFGNPSKSA
jgi:hypothetical protein